MITLSKKEQTEKANQIAANHHKFMVLDVENIKYTYNRKRFELAVEHLALCNSLNYIDEILEKTRSVERIDLSILFEALQHIQTDKPFNKTQLKKYFEAREQVEKITLIFESISDISEKLCFFEVDLILLGVSLSKQMDLEKEGLLTSLIDDYDAIINDAQKTGNYLEVQQKVGKALANRVKNTELEKVA